MFYVHLLCYPSRSEEWKELVSKTCRDQMFQGRVLSQDHGNKFNCSAYTLAWGIPTHSSQPHITQPPKEWYMQNQNIETTAILFCVLRLVSLSVCDMMLYHMSPCSLQSNQERKPSTIVHHTSTMYQATCWTILNKSELTWNFKTDKNQETNQSCQVMMPCEETKVKW